MNSNTTAPSRIVPEIIKAADYLIQLLHRIAFEKKPVRDLQEAQEYYRHERDKLLAAPQPPVRSAEVDQAIAAMEVQPDGWQSISGPERAAVLSHIATLEANQSRIDAVSTQAAFEAGLEAQPSAHSPVNTGHIQISENMQVPIEGGTLVFAPREDGLDVRVENADFTKTRFTPAVNTGPSTEAGIHEVAVRISEYFQDNGFQYENNGEQVAAEKQIEEFLRELTHSTPSAPSGGLFNDLPGGEGNSHYKAELAALQKQVASLPSGGAERVKPKPLEPKPDLPSPEAEEAAREIESCIAPRSDRLGTGLDRPRAATIIQRAIDGAVSSLKLQIAAYVENDRERTAREVLLEGILRDVVSATDSGTSLAKERERMPGIIEAAKSALAQSPAPTNEKIDA